MSRDFRRLSPMSAQTLSIVASAGRPLPREEVVRRGGHHESLHRLHRLKLIEFDQFYVDGKPTTLVRTTS